MILRSKSFEMNEPISDAFIERSHFGVVLININSDDPAGNKYEYVITGDSSEYDQNEIDVIAKFVLG
jgi:hypothetical protein